MCICGLEIMVWTGLIHKPLWQNAVHCMNAQHISRGKCLCVYVRVCVRVRVRELCARVCVNSLPVEYGHAHGAPGCGHAGDKAPQTGLRVPPGPRRK